MGGRRAPSSSGASSLRPCMPLSPTGRAAGVGPEPLVASFSRRDDGASASCGPLSRRDALLAAVPAALLWLPHGRALAGAAEDAAGLSLLQQKDTEDGGGASQEAKQYPKGAVAWGGPVLWDQHAACNCIAPPALPVGGEEPSLPAVLCLSLHTPARTLQRTRRWCATSSTTCVTRLTRRNRGQPSSR